MLKSNPLKITLNGHTRALRQSWEQLWSAPLSTVLTLLTLAICLSLPVWLYVGLKNAHQFSHTWEEGAQLTLFVDANLADSSRNSLLKTLKQHTLTRHVRYQSPEEVLKEMGSDPNLLAVLAHIPKNPLPAVITLQPNTADPKELEYFKNMLEKKAGIQEVFLNLDWTLKVQAFLHMLEEFALFLTLLVGSGGLLVIHNTLKLTFAKQKETFLLLNLLGASPDFVRRPFLYRGVFYGLLSGLMAFLITAVIAKALNPAFSQFFSTLGDQAPLQGLSLSDTFGGLALAASLGWAGARMATHDLLQDSRS